MSDNHIADYMESQMGLPRKADRLSTLERQLGEANCKLQALEIMLTAKGWGAAHGVVCEDYPNLLAMVERHAAIVRALADGKTP